jgi:hypothetical protein
MTVPSCQKHNAGKSLDDDYVRMVMSAMSDNINQKAALQHLVKHTIDEVVSSQAKMNLLFRNTKAATRNGRPTASSEISLERIVEFMNSVGRGALFYDRGLRWKGEVFSIPHFLIDETLPYDIQELSRHLFLEIDEAIAKGENKDVFYYIIADLSNGESTMFSVEMCFYREFYVTTCFRAHP